MSVSEMRYMRGTAPSCCGIIELARGAACIVAALIRKAARGPGLGVISGTTRRRWPLRTLELTAAALGSMPLSLS